MAYDIESALKDLDTFSESTEKDIDPLAELDRVIESDDMRTNKTNARIREQSLSNAPPAPKDRGEDFYRHEEEAEGILENIIPSLMDEAYERGKDIAAGGAGVVSGLGGGFRTVNSLAKKHLDKDLGVGKLGDVLTEVGNAAQEAYATENPDIFNNIGNAIGSMALFAGMGGGASGLARALTVSTRAAQLLGLSTMTGLEAFTEAGSVAEQVLQMTGGDEDAAHKAFGKAFALNLMVLAPTNYVAGYFGGKGVGTTVKQVLGQFAKGGFGEGLQEGIQEIIQAYATGEDLSKIDVWKRAGKSALVGSLVGGPTAVMTDTLGEIQGQQIREKQDMEMNEAESAIAPEIQNVRKQYRSEHESLEKKRQKDMKSGGAEEGNLRSYYEDRVSELKKREQADIRDVREKIGRKIQSAERELQTVRENKKAYIDNYGEMASESAVRDYDQKITDLEERIQTERRSLGWTESESKKATNTIEYIQQKETSGEMDPGAAAIAKTLINIAPDFDRDSTIRVSREVLEATPEILKNEGLEGEDASDYAITGRTVTKVHEDALRTAIDLYQGHDADTMVEEWYHRGFSRMSAEDRTAFENYHEETGDQRSVDEHFAQEGRDFFFSEKIHEKAGGIRKLFAKAKNSLKALIGRIRKIRGAKIPEKIQEMYRQAGEGKTQWAPVTEERTAAQVRKKSAIPEVSDTDEGRPIIPEKTWQKLEARIKKSILKDVLPEQRKADTEEIRNLKKEIQSLEGAIKIERTGRIANWDRFDKAVREAAQEAGVLKRKNAAKIRELKEKYARERKRMVSASKSEKKRIRKFYLDKIKRLREEADSRLKSTVEKRLETQKKRIQSLKEKQGDRIQKIKDRKEVERIVKSIKSLVKRRIPGTYRDRVNSILENLDLVRRSKKTIENRKSIREWVQELSDAGEIVPPWLEQELKMAEKVSISQIDLPTLRNIHSAIKQTVHLGRQRNKFLTQNRKASLDDAVGQMVSAIQKEHSVPPPEEQVGPRIPERKKEGINKAYQYMKDVFGEHRKVEFIARELDGFKEGVVQDYLIDPIQQAWNDEAQRSFEDGQKISNAMRLLERDGKLKSIRYQVVDFGDFQLNREQMMAVYANMGNAGNIARLVHPEGGNFSIENLNDIENALTANEKKFVRKIADLINSKWDDIARVTEELTGERPVKVEGEWYWPIVTDKNLSKQLKFHEKTADMFEDIFERIQVEKGFTIKRVGGKEAVSLDFFKVMMNHMNHVNHYITHAPAVRDVSKLLRSSILSDSIRKAVGEESWKQFQPWLKSVANPKGIGKDAIEGFVGKLRRNSTMAILGLKLSVSALQAGSYTQTIYEVGALNALKGLLDFYHNPARIADKYRKIMGLSKQMRFRQNSFDREVRNWLETDNMEALLKNKPSSGNMLFALIRGVDIATTLPTWWAAYNKMLNKTRGNVKQSVKYADGVVRRTQPSGSVKDLAQVSKGSEWKKLFTMFYTHYSNYHNQMTNHIRKTKKRGATIPNIVDFTAGVGWLLIVPGLMATFIRSFGTEKEPEEYLKGVIGYGGGGMIGMRDVVRLAMFDWGSDITTSGLSGPAEVGVSMRYARQAITESKKSTRKKKAEHALKHGVKGAGLMTGLVPLQLWYVIDAALSGSGDFREFLFGKYAIKKTAKKKGTFI
jgi:hypothetical protein